MPELLFQCLCPKTNFGPTITNELNSRASAGGRMTRVGVCHVASDLSQIRTLDVGCHSRGSPCEPNLQPKDDLLKVRKRRATTMKSKFVTGLVFAGLVWSAVPANAAAVVVSDLVSVSGTIFTVPETGDAESTAPLVLTSLGSGFVPGFGVVLTEPGLPPGTRAPSDVVVANSAGTLVFASDINDESGVFPPGTPTITSPVFLVETGDFQDVSDQFDLPVGTLQIKSDVSEVPLPAALPLFATGLVGLVLLGWRRKKKAAP